jgi:hypothetical protein
MKRISTLLILFLFSGMIYGQGPLTFGIKAGMNISKLPATYSADTVKNLISKNIYGAQAGIFLRIAIKKLYIQPEMYFSMKGGELSYDLSKKNSDSIMGTVNKKFTLYNVDIPIMIGYSLIDKDMFKFRAMAGPVASFNLTKNIDVSKTSGIKSDIAKDDLNSAIWSLQAGLGVDIWKLTFDARYEFGLNEVSNVTAESMKSRAILLSLGLKF